MTLNATIKKIETLLLSHRQIRTFRRGFLSDVFTDKTTRYPAACLQGNTGTVSVSQASAVLNFRLFFLDLVHAVDDTKSNELDVQSDMLSVAMDFIAWLRSGILEDVSVSTDNSITFYAENENDLNAGVSLDFTIRFPFTQNICQIPSDSFINDDEMRVVYDTQYIATGSEGTALVLPEIAGKKIIMIARIGFALYKVSNDPDETQFTWDNTTINFGLALTEGDRILILYRNY